MWNVPEMDDPPRNTSWKEPSCARKPRHWR